MQAIGKLVILLVSIIEVITNVCMRATRRIRARVCTRPGSRGSGRMFVENRKPGVIESIRNGRLRREVWGTTEWWSIDGVCSKVFLFLDRVEMI
jgi:hypothetical protein